MQKKLTEMEKLIRRIRKEFTKKKFIGDIVISDVEYLLLLRYLRAIYKKMLTSGVHNIIDPVYCVALVQVGIRVYDGNFWVHVKNLLLNNSYSVSHQGWLGTSFINTLKAFDKIYLTDSDRVDSILMHAFVSDKYADKFFNFLFSFYRMDLDRDISRLDSDVMNELIEIIRKNDNTGRTYWLVEHTADAVRNNSRGAKIRLRRYIKLIDKAFWGEKLPEKSKNRLIQHFIKWVDTSEELSNDKTKNGSNGQRKRKQFSAPYIKLDQGKGKFYLVIPSQIIKFKDYDRLHWSIQIGERSEEYEINPGTQGVTGYKTDELIVEIYSSEIFSGMKIEIKDEDDRIRWFKISEEKIRFFDESGNYVGINSLSVGMMISVTQKDFEPVSQAIIDKIYTNNFLYTFFDFVDSDIVSFPDGKPLSVNSKMHEGLLKRNIVHGVSVYSDDLMLPVYKSAPSVFVKILPKRISGTAIKVNGKTYKIFDNGIFADGITQFDLLDRSGEYGYVIELSKFGCSRDDVYNVTVDVPNDRCFRNYKFAVVNGLSYTFEGAPYIFNSRGTLSVPDSFQFMPESDKINVDVGDNKKRFNFDIVSGETHLMLFHQNMKLGFELPVFSYRFEGEEWDIMKPADTWHTEFNTKLQVRYIGDKISFYLDDRGEDDADEHFEIFTKIKEKNLFECDLNRFKSWFGREHTARKIYLSVPGKENAFLFQQVVTKSLLMSALLKGDFKSNKLNGVFDIIGKSDYYIDLFFNDSVIAEKIPLINGAFEIGTQLESGKYKAVVYEVEEDDSGFGEGYLYQIGEKELELVNPQDLNEKSFRILSVRENGFKSGNIFFGYNYTVNRLRRVEDGRYTGVMKVAGFNGTKLAAFIVNVEFFDFDKLDKVYITFEDDGDEVEFLYDEYKRKIVKEEDSTISKSEAYRRYKRSLYPEDYYFNIEFI